MSATIEVIEAYLEDVRTGAAKAALGMQHGDLEAEAAVARILANYAAALNDATRYHRWFVTVRDLLWEIAEADDRLSAGQLKDIARRWWDSKGGRKR